MKRYLPLLLIPLFSCKLYKPVEVEFDATERPAAPDYSQTAYWSALPDMSDFADTVPLAHLENKQGSAKADVFYIHPTTFLKDKHNWNASLEDEALNNRTDELPVMHQASIFNAAGKIYAPRYRQANLYSFYAQIPDAQKALDFAYGDVKTAFEYYLEHYNGGNPIIIACHSQGTFHGKRLVKEFFDGTDLQEQLVAAYLVGMPVYQNDFNQIKACETADETGCYLSWMTFKDGFYPSYYDEFCKGAVCVNPLNWSLEETYVSAEQHQGVVPRNFDEAVRCDMGARVNQGILWVDQPKFKGIPHRLVKNWHIADYNLFYLNVRQNVEQRLNAHLKALSSNESGLE